MEVFTGEHGDVVLYPDTFSLPNADTFSNQRHFPHPHPPQKLRPIRCNGRSFSEYCSSDDPLDPKPLTWNHEAGFYDPDTDNCGGDGGFIPPKDSNLGLPFQEPQIEAAALSSSSDESNKLQESIKEPKNKKRKRKSRKKLELFIENMMKTVIEKQEEMHRQLIEVLDKKEKERIIREEAWKQEEMERAKRDEEARSQEISRSLALITFIQNTLGQEIPIPNQNDNNNIIEETEFETSVKRWPKSEVQALIMVRAALNHKFNSRGPKVSIWEEVASGLGRMGYNRAPKKCKEKWENINKYYRRTMEKGKENNKNQSWSYFNELEMLYKNGFILHDEDEGCSKI